MYDKTFPFNHTIVKRNLAQDWTTMFMNKNSSFCGTVTSCNIKEENCLAIPAYSGRLLISTGLYCGEVLAPENIDSGYNETICV